LARRATPKPPQNAREEILRIRAVGAKGDGVAAGDIFVPYTLPGESVRACVVGDRGEAIEITEPSPDRTAPPCRHFGRCGGCALQHWREEAQRAWKSEMVETALMRHGVAGFRLAPIRTTPAAARRRATFAWKRAEGGAKFGFKARGTHDIGDISGCLILHKDLLGALPRLFALATHFPPAWRAATLSATICDNGLDLDIAPMVKGGEIAGDALQSFGEAMRRSGVIRASLHGAALLQWEAPILRFAGVPVTPPPGGFLQASREGEATLVGLVETVAAGARRAIDLFSGCGSFSFPLARTATVEAYDSDPAAIAALDAAARRSTLKPVAAARRDLFQRPLTAGEIGRADCVVFDPPRAGAAEQAAEIARSRAPLVIGVSCNPQTFARDAAILSQGGYALEEVTPVDQFVYSAHVELVGVFRRK
jgi:23S rRNA (uracil1939-C5)-methyltransferase